MKQQPNLSLFLAAWQQPVWRCVWNTWWGTIDTTYKFSCRPVEYTTNLWMKQILQSSSIFEETTGTRWHYWNIKCPRRIWITSLNTNQLHMFVNLHLDSSYTIIWRKLTFLMGRSCCLLNETVDNYPACAVKQLQSHLFHCCERLLRISSTFTHDIPWSCNILQSNLALSIA